LNYKNSSFDLKMMQRVIELAKSINQGKESCLEVPVAAIIVKDEKIISEGLNKRESKNSVFAHAEIEAIKKASKKFASWNLAGSTIYCSLEPCPMCAGAIQQSHISRVVFGAYEGKSGALVSRYQIHNKNTIILGGLMEEECKRILQEFFLKLRVKDLTN
jgi:tRNA(adenine34) deaminase